MTALRSSRALVALLLAALLAGRMVVPAGWMPVQTSQGFTIQLCSSSGAGEAWVDAAGKLHRGHQPGKPAAPKDPCPFAALPMPASLGSAPAVPAMLPVASLAPAIAWQAAAIGRGLAAPPPPATGPPLSA